MEPTFLTEISIAIGTIIINVVIFLRALHKNTQTLHDVKKELSPNCGSSLSDAVGRIETEVTKLSHWMSAFQNLYDQPIYKCNEHGSNFWVNNAYTRLVGVYPTDLEGHGWLAHIADADRQRVRDEWESAVKESRNFDLLYHVVNKISGKSTEVRGVAYPILVKNKLSGFIGTLTVL